MTLLVLGWYDWSLIAAPILYLYDWYWLHMLHYLHDYSVFLFSPEKDPDQLSQLTEALYTALEEGHMLGKKCKRRSLILKTIFKLLDLDSPKLLLKLARLIFSVCFTTNSSHAFFSLLTWLAGLWLLHVSTSCCTRITGIFSTRQSLQLHI